MTRPSERRRGPRRRAAAAALLALAAGGCGTAEAPGAALTAGPPAPARPVAGAAAGAAADAAAGAAPGAAAGARRIAIPAIGVAAAVGPLGRRADGRLAVPRDPARAGWWAPPAAVRRLAPLVIVGHVDSRTGPAVFTRLRELRRGDAVTVEDTRGRRRRFAVERREEHPKDAFPSTRVYAGERSLLRLVTCSGRFDPQARHYDRNLIVFARPAGRGRASG